MESSDVQGSGVMCSLCMTSRCLAAQHETVYKISSSNLQAHITGMRTDLTFIVRGALQETLIAPNESARSCLLIGFPGQLFTK